MNTSKLTAALLFVGIVAVVHAQGPLDPPAGDPEPSMKTLTQIEPRTDLATIPGGLGYMHRIREPGSSYLSDNLNVTTTSGIQIAASGVTLDLNGFNIFRSSGDSPLGTAMILTSGASANIRIKNGHITSGVTYDSGAGGDQFTGGGFQSGIRETSVFHSRAESVGSASDDIRASGNVSNSHGRSSEGDGIRGGIISYSRGNAFGNGDGLRCTIAIGCISLGGENITHKYVMP